MGLLVKLHVVGEGEGVWFRGVYRYVCTLEQRCGVEVGWLIGCVWRGCHCVVLSSVLSPVSLQRHLVPFPQGQLPSKEDQTIR